MIALRPFFCIFVLAAPALAGCSTKSWSGRVKNTTPFAVELFTARGFLGGSDYERYHLLQETLWRECGNILPNPSTQHAGLTLEGDEHLEPDPNLHIVERRVDTLSEKEFDTVERMISRLLDRLAARRERPPAPGAIFSLMEPGLVELRLRHGERQNWIVTSVDAVADGESALLAEVHELFRLIRGSGPAMCGRKSFFGI